MKERFNDLRIKQLARMLAPLSSNRISRPKRGWAEAIRKIAGLTLREVAPRMGVSYQTVAALEKAEAEDRITLKSLKALATILGCDVVYALVPKEGTLRDLMEKRLREKVSKDVAAVEHTMSLEGQGVGNVKEKIDEETKRLSSRKRENK